MSPADPRHGQVRGYYAHLAADERPCEPCRVAMNVDKREKRQRLKDRDRAIFGTPPGPDPDALTGGRWMPADGIMRWVEDVAS